MNNFERLLKENSGLLSRMKIRDGNNKLNEICEEIFKKELTNSITSDTIKSQKDKKRR